MQLFNSLPLLLSFSAIAAAWPLSEPALTLKRDEITKRDIVSAPYYLKTKVFPGYNESFDGLYVQSYHTGAGMSDATLGDEDSAVLGFLNSTVQQFNITTTYPWSFFMPQPTTYDAWYPVRLNPGALSTDFFLNETGLQWSSYESFGGWLACDWSHGVPQLFWRVIYASPVYSSNCAPVELYPKYID